MFKMRDVNRDYLDKLMLHGLKKKIKSISKMRGESLDELLEKWRSEKSYDKSLCNQKSSPTYKSHSHSFQKLNEEKNKFYTELDEIIKELESD